MDKKERGSQPNGELAKALQEVDKLHRKVHNLEEQLRYYKNKSDRDQNIELCSRIKWFRNQYQDIGRVYYVWIQADKKEATEQIRIKIQEVSALLESKVRGGQNHLGSLTDNLNRSFGDVLIHLKKDFPIIGPADYNLFCYLAAGFDDYLIIELLGLSGKGLLYTRKCRLKGKLKRLNTPYKSMYMALIQ